MLDDGIDFLGSLFLPLLERRLVVGVIDRQSEVTALFWLNPWTAAGWDGRLNFFRIRREFGTLLLRGDLRQLFQADRHEISAVGIASDHEHRKLEVLVRLFARYRDKVLAGQARMLLEERRRRGLKLLIAAYHRVIAFLLERYQLS